MTGQRFIRAIESLQDPASNRVRFSIGRFDPDGRIAACQRSLESIHVEQGACPILECVGVVWSTPDRFVEAREGLFKTLQALQNVAPVVERIRTMGVEPDDFIVACQCCIEPIEQLEDMGAVVDGIGITGLESDRRIMALERLFQSLQVLECRPQVRMVEGLPRIDRDCLCNQIGCRRSVAPLQADDPEEMQRIGMLRVAFQHLAVKPLGAFKITLLMVRERCLEHDWVKSGWVSLGRARCHRVAGSLTGPGLRRNVSLALCSMSPHDGQGMAQCSIATFAVPSSPANRDRQCIRNPVSSRWTSIRPIPGRVIGAACAKAVQPTVAPCR